MHHLLGVAFVLATGLTTTPQTEFELPQVVVTPQPTVALAASESVKAGVQDFVVKKRLAPLTQQRIIEAALQPSAPALPVPRDTRIQTAKKVVDQILKDTPRVVPQSVNTIGNSLAKEESNGWATIRSVARSNGVPTTLAPVAAKPIADAVVDTVKSKANKFIVADPTDDQFILTPRPISVDFQEQVKAAADAVTETIEETPIAQPGASEAMVPVVDDLDLIVEPDQNIADIIEQPTPDRVPTTTDVNVEAETVEIESELVEPVDVSVDEPQPAVTEAAVEPVVTTPAVVTTQETQSLSAGDSGLMEVIDSWTSLDESTRQSILLLLRADQVIKDQATN